MSIPCQLGLPTAPLSSFTRSRSLHTAGLAHISSLTLLRASPGSYSMWLHIMTFTTVMTSTGKYLLGFMSHGAADFAGFFTSLPQTTRELGAGTTDARGLVNSPVSHTRGFSSSHHALAMTLQARRDQASQPFLLARHLHYKCTGIFTTYLLLARAFPN